MAFHPFVNDSTPTSTASNTLILSGVTQVIITPYTESGGSWTLGSDSYTLDNIIADTVAISQDDPEENTIDCETRDEPIKKTVVNGNFNVEMTSADIQKTILEKCFGYTYDSTLKYLYAPAQYKEIYAALEFTFGGLGTENASLVCPKVQLSSKIDASSLKSETVKGTISGTCMSYNIGTAQAPVMTPFFVNLNNA